MEWKEFDKEQPTCEYEIYFVICEQFDYDPQFESMYCLLAYYSKKSKCFIIQCEDRYVPLYVTHWCQLPKFKEVNVKFKV